MVSLVRRGQAQRAVARRFGVPVSTVQHWVRRARAQPLAAVDFCDQRGGPARPANRTPAPIERRVLAARAALQAGALGFVGAQAIADTLRGALGQKLPSVRTIGRILQRHGVLDRHARRRQSAPPPGWYLPAVAAQRAELESFDVIEDLRLEGGPLLSVLTARALWGPRAAAWPQERCGAAEIIAALLAHWRAQGLPDYAQFDNDTRFQGGHNHPDVFGRVVRLCLQLGVVPVFAPPAEHGFQNLIESFNALWQAKVWARFHHADLPALRALNERFLLAWHRRHARQEPLTRRRKFPARFGLDWQAPLRGLLIYLRRCDERGRVRLLGRRFEVDAQWPHRLVRAEVDLEAHVLRFYRLRRKDPADQSLIATQPYHPPQRRFLTT